MERFVNARIPLLLVAMLSAGIATGYLLLRYKIQLFWVTAAIPVAAVIFILLLIFTKKLKYPVIVVFVLALFLISAISCFMRLESYGKSNLTDGESYKITATVCDKGKNSAGEYIIVNGVKADGEKVSGKAYILLPKVYGDYCETGYKVSFYGKALKYDTFPYGKLNYNAEKNIKHRFILYGTIEAERGFSLFGSIRNSLQNALYKNLDTDTASIAYAMLTGNTQDVESGTLDSFRYGGIAHIFAVSGLHIGIVFGALSFILRKLKINKYISAPVCLLSIIFYSGVCGFTLSSVRAVIMCATVVIAKLFNKKYDALNALSVAAILMLIISPLSLFSAGFQLSVCAVFGICALSKSVARPLKKLPKRLSSAVGVSLGAQAGTAPVMLLHFGYLSGAGLLLNLIILPILSVIFQIIFAAVLIGLVIPPAASLIIPYAALPLEAVTSFLIDAGFEKAIISGFGAGAFILFYFLCLLTLSDKINLTRLKRCASFLCAFFVTVAYVIVKTVAPVSGYRIVASAYYGGSQTLIKSKSGNVLIVTENLNAARLDNLLSENYAFDLDAVIILGGEDCVTAFGGLEVNAQSVYVYGMYINLQPYKNTVVNYETKFTVGGADFEFYDGYSLLINCGGVEVGVCAGDSVPFDKCGIVISSAGAENCECEYSVCYDRLHAEYNLYDCGDITFSIKNGGIAKTR